MNCPQCQQPIGADQFIFGKWVEYFDEKGNPLGIRRTVAIECGFCGLFEIEQDHDQHVTQTHGPFTNRKDVRRLERSIPSAKFTRRISS